MIQFASLRPAYIAALAVLGALAPAASALAQQSSMLQSLTFSPHNPPSLRLIQQARQLSLREVAQIIEARTPGRLSDAQLVEQNGRMVYVIRWEPSEADLLGRILIFVVDAETGAILSRRGG